MGMEQFRQIGEVAGSLKALMVFRQELQINRRQCCLLLDMLTLTYESIAEEMKQNLRFEEKHTKWKIIEQPLKELHRIFKETEIYIRHCLEPRDWWVQAITHYKNKDCVEFYVHNLLSCVPVVIEAIEIAGEVSGSDPEEIQKQRSVYSMKYQKDFKDPKLFQWRFGKQYVVFQEICDRFDSVWDEDRWVLLNKIKNKRSSSITKHEHQLTDIILTNLNESGPSNKLLPSSILLGSKDYHMRRRLGSGKQYKEMQWRGENFVLRHFIGDVEASIAGISRALTLSHPNVMPFFCGFTDDEKKECYLVMELMNRDLSSYIKEINGQKRRLPFSLPVAVDLMVQLARGMEYLHSKGIYHGELNPSNVFLKSRNVSTDGYLHAKVSGFGFPITSKSNSNRDDTRSFIWYGPEVLATQELSGNNWNEKPTEKSDVYSFGMICFQLLTGKVPFEDGHLQGDKMSRNIRAGERPLFPFHSPKYLVNLTKKCWRIDPSRRPSFSSICRILQYVKRFLLLNPDHSNPDPPLPTVDYCEIEAGLLKKFPNWGDGCQLSQIPFQMFAYRVAEKEKSNEKSNANQREVSESGSEETSMNSDENVITDPEISIGRSPSSKRSTDTDDSISERKSFALPKRSMSARRLSEMDETLSERKSITHRGSLTKRSMSMSSKRLTDVKVNKHPGSSSSCK